VGNGNIDVDSKSPITGPGGQTGKPSVRRWFGRIPLPETLVDGRLLLRIKRSQLSGAMAEQRGDNSRGDQSAPQELVRLVGCRTPKERSE
jgi:hypothetical protein